jgi:hypothetical protein
VQRHAALVYVQATCELLAYAEKNLILAARSETAQERRTKAKSRRSNGGGKNWAKRTMTQSIKRDGFQRAFNVCLDATAVSDDA